MKNYTANVKKVLLNFYEEGVSVSKIRKGLSHEKEEEELPSLKDMQHELDEFGRVKDVLWVDARSRAAYEYFGDVVCFDATYLTNQYELPFANFVGVNHHGQSILLGYALVSRETTKTYKWVFKQWLACMGNRAPIAILTDQAASMRNALAQTMPTARHRWCIWHIVKKFSEKLGKCKGYKDFKSPLKAIIYKSFTVEEFERRWCECMKKFSLEDNEWLVGLYEERHMWIPAFMREYFWAGMKTTQLWRALTVSLMGLLIGRQNFANFRAMTKRVQDENEADAKATKYMRRLVSGFQHEAFFQKIYTDAKFQEIQRELSRLMYCYDRGEHVIDDTTVRYVIKDREDASAADEETVQLVIDSLSTLHIEVKDRRL
ncbi:protein FAR1-RELATED SEQUENCE 8-like [Chenopodium quinoa]|uniref:protein FAR1-RELATED SEQUENCE 8-like n=1 Tax=Chenopodium quinoa TaxID=63459 RepID=UPI000B7735ED|nr:protein FAR1-RELATED SEQUENCE 8-like [Chenopodium quinoa]